MEYVREEVLAPMYHPAENARWKAIIASLPKADLTPPQTAFLNSVVARIATNPAISPGMDPASAADLRVQQAAEMQKVQAEIAQRGKGQAAQPGAGQPAP